MGSGSGEAVAAGVIEGLSAEPPDGVAPDAAGEPSAGPPDGVTADAIGAPPAEPPDEEEEVVGDGVGEVEDDAVGTLPE